MDICPNQFKTRNGVSEVVLMIQPDGEFQHSKCGFRLVNSEYIWGLTWVFDGVGARTTRFK